MLAVWAWVWVWCLQESQCPEHGIASAEDGIGFTACRTFPYTQLQACTRKRLRHHSGPISWRGRALVDVVEAIEKPAKRLLRTIAMLKHGQSLVHFHEF